MTWRSAQTFTQSLVSLLVVLMLTLGQAACSVCSHHADDALVAKTGAGTAAPKVPARRIVERIELQLADGTSHTALLSFPENSHGALPALIVLGGFDTGEKSLELLREDLNVVYATTDYPYKAPNERGFLSDLREFPAIRSAVFRMDLAVDALIATLQKNPRIDREKVSIVGASFGAPFAITAAVRNVELDGVVLIHAFGRVDLAITRQLVNKWGAWSCPISWVLGHAAWIYLGYYDPEVESQKLHPRQKVLYIHSEADEQLPPESIERLKAALVSSRAEITTAKSRGGHLGPGKFEMIDELMEMSLGWLDHRGLL